MLAALLLAVAAAPPTGHVVPLRYAHAHNDYARARPLAEALSRGFTSVEADVFLLDGELLVGHTYLDLRRDRTLESLYLAPLRRHVRGNGGRVYNDGSPFFLMIDLKTDGATTYAALAPLLAKYADILSETRDGRHSPRAVTAVLSGNCPRPALAAAKVRHAGIDGRPGDLNSDAPAHLMPYISASWSAALPRRKAGPLTGAEKKTLADYCAAAHKGGRLVRFWATPEDPALWRDLRACGVDLLNTDRPAEMQRFLLSEK